MKIKTILIALSVMMLLMISGCATPMCYPPSKVIGNKCCIDEDDDGVCDYDQGEETPAQEEPVAEPEEPAEPETPVESEEPTIEKVPMPEAKPEPVKEQEFGKMKIGQGEPKKYLEITEINAFRTSRDKGMLDEIQFTVRNIGTTKITPTVEFFFDNEGMDFSDTERVYEYPLKVIKEYKLDPLEPGEKHVILQSLGIRFQGIEQTKDISLSVYDRASSPKKTLAVIEKNIKPTDYFETMDIYTYSRPEE